MRTTVEVQDSSPNGAFLANVAPQAAYASDLSRPIDTVTTEYVTEGALDFALGFMQELHVDVLLDLWENGALEALEDSQKASGFNDTTSVGKVRSRADYLERPCLHPLAPENPANMDPKHRFPGLRPRGFAIGPDDQPVMAIVALDPERLDATITDNKRLSLIAEVNNLRAAAASNDKAVRETTAGKMSTDLRQILGQCLLANDTIIETSTPAGTPERWSKPFDVIASLKALYTLLSGKDSSAAMRQGAVRMTNSQGRQIIVGGSGLNSAIDEMVARNFARDVLAAYTA